MQDEIMKILDESEIRHIEYLVKKNYGQDLDLSNFIVIQKSEEKIWIISKELEKIEFQKLAVNSIGMYFGKIKKNEKIHLSIEGCQIVGRYSKRNLIELSKEDAERFLRGGTIVPKNIEGCDLHNFVIIKSGNDFVGSGLLTETGITNLTPKSRRLPL